MASLRLSAPQPLSSPGGIHSSCIALSFQCKHFALKLPFSARGFPKHLLPRQLKASVEALCLVSCRSTKYHLQALPNISRGQRDDSR